MISPGKRFSSTRSLQQAFWCRGAKVERIARFFVFLDICDPFYPGIFFQAEGVLPKQPPSEVGVQTCRRSQNYSVFFATCDLLHLVHFWGSQEKEAAAVPREAKLQKIANLMFLLLLPIFCNLCHFSICRTKTIVQASIYQEPFGVVGQRGVARHLLCKCLAQSATFKQIYDRARGCLNQEKRNIIIGLYPQMC